MRYLWIEDFDGGKSGRTEIKSRLEKYFQLEDKNINLCTLKEALSFLDNLENWEKFDVILIDIRFKVADTEEEEEAIYKSYFSSFLTHEKYEEYTYKIGKDINSSSAGVLLYLALVHRYNCNEERIAFISANVDNNSSDLIQINDMKEFVLKAKYESLSKEDIADFSLLNEDVFEKYKEITGRDDDEANITFAIPPTDEIDWDNPESLSELSKQIEKVLKEIQEIKPSVDDKTNLKYNSVKQEFEGVGLKVPRAFEKPTGDTKSEISWQFKIWVETINTDYYKLRSTILKSCLHMKGLFNTEAVKITYKYDPDPIKVETELENMIAKIAELFPINEWTKNNESFYTRVIKECASLADCIKLNKEEKSINEVAKETLKLVRNWTSHQGINSISSFDAAYVYMMMLYVFFDSDKCMEDIAGLEDLLVELSAIKVEELNYEEKEYDKIVEEIEKNTKKIHKDAYDRFIQRVGIDEAKRKLGVYRYDDKAGVYDTVSGIGNQNSDMRDSVCMKYVYLLYLSVLKKKAKDKVYKCIFKQSQEQDNPVV